MQPGAHGVLASANHDELARERFMITLRDLALRMNRDDNTVIYEKRVAPAFEREHGRPPKDRHEIRKAMLADPYTQMASVIRLVSQEMMWDAVGECVERQLPELVEKGHRLSDNNHKLGSLTLDPKLVPPHYVTAVDIHRMPGNYFSELMPDDVYAGALYDRGVFIRSKGLFGAYMDEFGQSFTAWLKETYPDFKPRRILDVGCTIGHSTLPLCEAFPDAEVQAIDVAAPMLRYGHARAESLGKAVHFSQQNAESTNFPNESFDLVVSFALLHETSNSACKKIMREAYRLLAPGGLCLFFEAPPWRHMSEYQAWVHDWETYYNCEPFLGAMHDLDEKALMVEAGFDPARYVDVYIPSANTESSIGTFGGGGKKGKAGQYWFFGGWKP
jgi:ubiquinone/menaquinone biosynthesis C-methylase UbiE